MTAAILAVSILVWLSPGWSEVEERFSKGVGIVYAFVGWLMVIVLYSLTL